MIHRTAPGRYALKAVTVHADSQERSVVVTEIADETGRTVFAQATEPLEAVPGPADIQAIEQSAQALAGFLTSLAPQHWLPGGKHILTLHDGSEEPWGVTLVNADKWTISAPDARTADGHLDGPVEIAYPAATAAMDGSQPEPAYPMTQSVYRQIVAGGIGRAVTIADALRNHRLQMRAASAVIG